MSILGIFALFRKLHFRIDRKVTTEIFARYGLDEGLREADQDKRVLAIKENFPALHEEMLQHHWSVRDFVGFKEKKHHNNSELIHILLHSLQQARISRNFDPDSIFVCFHDFGPQYPRLFGMRNVIWKSGGPC